MSQNLKVIISGGGIGGHFYPAIAIGNKLKSLNVDVKYIGSQYGIESTLLNNDDNDITLLNIRGIQRHLNVESLFINCVFPFRFIHSYIKSRELIKDFKPHVVIGTGGYSSGLPLLAAIHKGIKTVIHEQNSFPGITTRKLVKKVTKVCIAFEDAKAYFKNNNVILTGNPVRNNICLIDKSKAKESYHFDIGRPVLAISGGSQGSVPFNRHFQIHLDQYIKSNKAVT